MPEGHFDRHPDELKQKIIPGQLTVTDCLSDFKSRVGSKLAESHFSVIKSPDHAGR